MLTYGGIVQRLLVPDRNGEPGDVVLGFSTLEEYIHGGSLYLGAIVGRYANRIAGASFELDGVRLAVSQNDGRNSLHGGTRGFDKQVWRAVEAGVEGTDAKLSLAYTSPDGEMGYPGTLEVVATYLLSTEGVLSLDFQAATDRPTVLNLTGHAYWNLAGEGSGAIDDQLVTVHAGRYVEVDRELIPTGATPSVAATRFDLRGPRPVGALVGGCDLTFVLDRESADPGALVRAADLRDPQSGRSVSIFTSEPGIHLYTGHGGLALETQHFPDSPNRPGFPSTVLRPGEKYSSRTVWIFGADLIPDGVRTSVAK